MQAIHAHQAMSLPREDMHLSPPVRTQQTLPIVLILTSQANFPPLLVRMFTVVIAESTTTVEMLLVLVQLALEPMGPKSFMKDMSNLHPHLAEQALRATHHRVLDTHHLHLRTWEPLPSQHLKDTPAAMLL